MNNELNDYMAAAGEDRDKIQQFELEAKKKYIEPRQKNLCELGVYVPITVKDTMKIKNSRIAVERSKLKRKEKDNLEEQARKAGNLQAWRKLNKKVKHARK